jgi:hypothetical protein
MRLRAILSVLSIIGKLVKALITESPPNPVDYDKVF